jgi:two-component system, OmpR family, response regulator
MAQDLSRKRPSQFTRMIRNLIVEIELAEPAVNKLQRHFLAQAELMANVIAVADQEHLDHQLGIDRGSTDVAVKCLSWWCKSTRAAVANTFGLFMLQRNISNSAAATTRAGATTYCSESTESRAMSMRLRLKQFVPTQSTRHSASPFQILVVDEDPDECRAIIEYLKTHEIRGDAVNKLDEIKCRVASGMYDFVILDLLICRNIGLSLLSDIRCQSTLPMIVTAPSHIDEGGRVAALELGADDCITKPFGPAELLARIRAILRRCAYPRGHVPHSANPGPRKPRYCRFGGWQVDRRTRRLTADNGRHMPLTKGEYALLIAFIDSPMVTLSRERLVLKTRLRQDLCGRSIDVQILRLRRKLQLGLEMECIIRTVRGSGYMFMSRVENVG